MRVLIACEFSGIVRDAFIERGHNAMSCDLLPTERPGPHYQGDVRDILGDGWDMMIAHPPCTYLSNSGAQHLWVLSDGASFEYKRQISATRWASMVDGANFFKELLTTKIEKVCVENPIMHRHAKRVIGMNQTQLVEPWQFGHLETKATCLWLVGLPKLQPTKIVYDEMIKLPKKEYQRIYHMSPSKDRGKFRSITFPGIAQAMAEQWG